MGHTAVVDFVLPDRVDGAVTGDDANLVLVVVAALKGGGGVGEGDVPHVAADGLVGAEEVL